MAAPALQRVRLHVRGTVQGVGFRPFVYRTARELGVAGWVGNDPAGVVIEAEAAPAELEQFQARLFTGAPPHAHISELESEWLEPTEQAGFEIRASESAGQPTALVLPDLATCPECLRDLREPGNLRHRYAFTNCTHCGPRFTIVQALPYDRPNTTMAGFALCPQCAAEYRDPGERRFHAQPNACPACGPHLRLLDAAGGELVARGEDEAALAGAVHALRNGGIVAVKGIGGFLLLCVAGDDAAVATLRERKHRPRKPFAVMVRDLAMARAIVAVDDAAAVLLADAAAPIVLLPHLAGSGIAAGVAPGNPALGIMLPYAPLLHLLLADLGEPVVATSGNLSEEPICIDDQQALARLGGIADLLLTHDRPIERHVDDSVAWLVAGAPRLLRRARGYAPLPVTLTEPVPPLLAVGAQLKNAVAVARGREVFLSQHIGDLETVASQAAFARVIADLCRFYRIEPVAIVHDLHPDYSVTQWALQARLEPAPRRIAVQHHHAHLASCLAENNVREPALGIIWDGTGLGPDGSIWGGEFLLGDAAGYRRVAHLRQFRLPGGDAAVVEPPRVALALLAQLDGADREGLRLPALERLGTPKRRALEHMLASGFNAPLTSSAGRLFDGVAALLDLVPATSFEGEAAMALEFVVDRAERGAYPLPLGGDGALDWRPTLHDLLHDLRAGTSAGRIAARFHNALVHAALAVAERAGEPRVALSGGCFQNRVLTERLAAALALGGFEVLLHRQVPPNDGGIALGQVVIAAAQLRGREE